MINLEYDSLEKLFNDFSMLFENCITYWRGFNARTGHIYIQAAMTMQQEISDLFTKTSQEMPELAFSALDLLNKERIERKQLQQERKRQEARSLSYSTENKLPPVPAEVSPWSLELEYSPSISTTTSSAPLTRTHSRMINSYGDVVSGGPR